MLKFDGSTSMVTSKLNIDDVPSLVYIRVRKQRQSIMPFCTSSIKNAEKINLFTTFTQLKKNQRAFIWSRKLSVCRHQPDQPYNTPKFFGNPI